MTTQTKLIRHFMSNVAPPPKGTTQHQTSDVSLIKALLVAKMHEEAEEVARAATLDDLLTELADLYECVHAMATMHRFSIGQVHGRAPDKAEERGPLIMTGKGGQPVAVIHRVKLP